MIKCMIKHRPTFNGSKMQKFVKNEMINDVSHLYVVSFPNVIPYAQRKNIEAPMKRKHKNHAI